MNRLRVHISLATCFLTLASGCTKHPPAPVAESHEDLDATVWMRTSGEYYAAAQQAYSVARTQLTVALANPNWSALPDQQSEMLLDHRAPRPSETAVIIDLDETVLDNTLYQVDLIERDDEFDPATWSQWVASCASTLVPGANEFIEAAHELGVHVFFITNRVHSDEPPTRRNLEQLGLVDPNALDNILSKGERETWSSNKQSRRAFVARRYRVLLLIGDDLNDFVWAGDSPSASARRQLAETHADMWGRRWFLIPNPNYGGWERAVYKFDDGLPRNKKIEAKRSAIEASTNST